MKIELRDENKSEICEMVLRSLPQWFGIESAILDYIQDVQTMPMLVAVEEGRVLGFLTLNFHNKYTAEVHVMGVLQEFHRKNIGRALIKTAEEHLRGRSFKYLTVKTLSESRSNEEYGRTRNFYYGMDFIPVEEFKTLWGEHNPCLFMIKSL